MLIVELGVKCKTQNCKGAPSVGIITVESPQALNEWMKGFRPQDINYPICKQTAVYSQADLQVSLVPE